MTSVRLALVTYHPWKGLEPPREYKVEAVGEFVKRIDEARKTAKQALEKAASIMKQQYDKHRKPAIEYNAYSYRLHMGLKVREKVIPVCAKEFQEPWEGQINVGFKVL